MPQKNPSSAAALSASDMILRDELKADVQHLAGDIGERNLSRYPQLNAAADWIEKSFMQAVCNRAATVTKSGAWRVTISKWKSGEYRRRSYLSARITILFLGARCER